MLCMQSSKEQTSKCSMWARRRFDWGLDVGIALPEEPAFAADSSVRLGGRGWPPRSSYSCSFCRREFRSAQALGGHMNVHRRDRARLKHSPPSDLEENTTTTTTTTTTNIYLRPQHHHLHLHPDMSSPIIMCSPNPTHGVVESASPLSPPAYLSEASSEQNCTLYTNLPSTSRSSPINQRYQRKSYSLEKYAVPAEIELGRRNSKIGDNAHGDQESTEKIEANISNSCKKQRMDVAPPKSFLRQDFDGCHHHTRLQSEVPVPDNHVTLEELDLELRLGHRPNVEAFPF